MKRFIVFHEGGLRADGWLLWFVVLLAALVLALALATTAAAATAYYSFQGQFTDGTETQSFLFNLNRALPPRTLPFSLRTWHYDGGTNAAGESIDPGGFDPILRLHRDTPPLFVENDDGPTGRDSLINWATSGMPESLAAGDYGLDLVAYNGTLGVRDGHWAVDLEADAASFTLTGVERIDNTGGTTISSLTMGTDDVRVPVKLELGTFESLSILGPLTVGKTGAAEVTVTTGSLESGTGAPAYSYLGYEPSSVGTVTLKLGGSWVDNVANIHVGWQGEGNLNIESGGLASFNGLVTLGESGGSEGNLTVTGWDSILITNLSLLVGEGGVGYMRIEDRGKVYSTGQLYFDGDNVGTTLSSRGTVEVDGKDALWSSGPLLVGNWGQGTVRITSGGKIATSGNAFIGVHSDSHDSSVTLTGAAPDGTPATWQVSGNLFIAGGEGYASSATNSKLTINPGGLVDILDTTTVWESGGNLELLGGELETGSLIVKPGATFTHTDGTLTVNGGTFTAELGTHTIDSGGTGRPTLRLENGSQGSVEVNVGVTPANQEGILYVGRDGHGRMEIVGGSHLVSGAGLIAWGTTFPGSGDGSVLVQGNGSIWELTAEVAPGAYWGQALAVGLNGAGTLEIRDRGQVVVHNSSAGIGNLILFSFEQQSGPGIAIVDGANSLLRVERHPSYASGGYLVIGADPVVGTSGSLTVSNAGHVEVDKTLYVDDTGALTVASQGIVTAGDINVSPLGTIELNNGGINTGSLELAGGTLRGDGDVSILSSQLTNAGVVAPGLSAGVLNVNGNYVQDTAGTLAIEIGGAAPYLFDRLQVNGSATLGGLLDVSLIDPAGGTDVFVPSAGQTFEILTAAGGLGGTEFLGQVLPPLSGGLYFDVLYGPNIVTLAVLGVLGDYNHNGTVDAADYVVWRETYSGPNVPPTSLAADGDGDGDVDGDDYDVWTSHFGMTVPVVVIGNLPGRASGAIPEPSALSLAALTAIAIALRRPNSPSNEGGE